MTLCFIESQWICRIPYRIPYENASRTGVRILPILRVPPRINIQIAKQNHTREHRSSRNNDNDNNDKKFLKKYLKKIRK